MSHGDRLSRYARALGASVIRRTTDIVLTGARALEADAGLPYVALKDGRMLTDQPWDERVRARARMAGITEVLVTTLVLDAIRARCELPTDSGASSVTSTEPATAPARLLSGIVQQAVEAGASDVHIETRDTGTRVRLRLGGELVDTAELPRIVGEQLASYLFSTAGGASRAFNGSEPCHASCEVSYGDQCVALRLASVPDVSGHDVIVRIATESTVRVMNDVGCSPQQQIAIDDAFRASSGAIIFSGPTGSGKSTTMRAALASLPAARKVVSIEQPIEVRLSNVTQVGSTSGRSLAAASADFHRWDCDVAVIGEVRTSQDARALMDLITAGTLVVATVHASSADAIPRRLMHLGLDADFLSEDSTLRLLVCQRLVPKLCRKCAVRATRQIGLARGAGCAACRHAGVHGRVLLMELVSVSARHREHWVRRGVTRWRAALRRGGWTTMADQACEAVLDGRLDWRDARSAVSHDELVRALRVCGSSHTSVIGNHVQ